VAQVGLEERVPAAAHSPYPKPSKEETAGAFREVAGIQRLQTALNIRVNPPAGLRLCKIGPSNGDADNRYSCRWSLAGWGSWDSDHRGNL